MVRPVQPYSIVVNGKSKTITPSPAAQLYNQKLISYESLLSKEGSFQAALLKEINELPTPHH